MAFNTVDDIGYIWWKAVLDEFKQCYRNEKFKKEFGPDVRKQFDNFFTYQLTKHEKIGICNVKHYSSLLYIKDKFSLDVVNSIYRLSIDRDELNEKYERPKKSCFLISDLQEMLDKQSGIFS